MKRVLEPAAISAHDAFHASLKHVPDASRPCRNDPGAHLGILEASMVETKEEEELGQHERVHHL
jgi:hypothetical protein